MNVHDLCNGAFEAVGCYACWKDVLALRTARRAVGVHWQTRGFFAVWGAWNLVYYSHLDHWVSFAAGVGIAAANVVWTALYLYYRGQK